MPSISSLEPAFLHCGVHFFFSMLPLQSSLSRQGVALAHLDSSPTLQPGALDRQLCSFSLMLHPDGFFLSVTNITKLKRLRRAASRAITGCLSSFPIPLLLSKAYLPPLRVTLTHFTLSSYERALRLLTSFPILGVARLGVKSRLCRSSRTALASTYLLISPSTSPRKVLLACPPSPP